MSIRSEYKQRKHLALLAAGVVLLICWPWPAARGEETEATIVNDLGEFPRNVLRQYCLDCHSGTDPEGDFDMDPIVTGNIASLRSAAWRKIAVALKNGQMPPGDAVQLSEAERQQAVRSIEDQLAVEDCNGEQDPGRVTIRRLNHREYRNTIRDLLGVDFIHSDDFPADDVGYGFDNIGDVLSVAPLTLEKYLKSAERVLDRSIVDRVAVEPATQYFDPQQLKRAPEMKSEPGWLTNNGVLFQQATIPRNGRYLLRVWAWQTKAGPDTARMAIKLNGRSLQEFDVAARKENAEKYEVSVTIEKGTHRIAAEFLNDYWNPKAEKHRDRNLYVDSIEVIGPNDTQAPELPATHRRIFFVQPDKNTTQQEAAATIIRQFAARAFRRPVQEDELQRLVKLYQLADQDGQPFEASVKLALTGVLVSPHFLFRVEIDREPSGPFGAYRISDYELASRLSYFLWSTMPDDELTRLASDNRLHKPQVLDQQVARMLQDP
ncbi:MAG TPA: DUF1587 domain-containing protein, partial [Pirellulales bacterium]|nr:DUF1587 domain-containing protein [Pirellulales bacterium]